MTSIFKHSSSSLSHRNDNRNSSALSTSSKVNVPSAQSPQTNTVGFSLSCLDLTKKQPFLFVGDYIFSYAYIISIIGAVSCSIISIANIDPAAIIVNKNMMSKG